MGPPRRRTRATRQPPRRRDTGRGAPLSSTIIRYLASTGATKDSVGLMSLSDRDLRRIEEGIPSIHHGDRSGLRERIDEVLFELERYHATGDPSGYSLAMRLEFWKAGSTIARDHWIAGVGTPPLQKNAASLPSLNAPADSPTDSA